MSGGRFVVLGLAPARSRWSAEVSGWSTSGAMPVEFLRCVSTHEVRLHLAGGRPVSALVADSGASGLDRDLVDAASAACVAVILVAAAGCPAPDLPGVFRVLDCDFGRDDLVSALEAVARAVPRVVADAERLVTHADFPPADFPPADFPPADFPPADFPPADLPPADLPFGGVGSADPLSAAGPVGHCLGDPGSAELSLGKRRSFRRSATRPANRHLPHFAGLPGSAESAEDPGLKGHLIAVTGAGGTGVSVVAMALAQELGADPLIPATRPVVLVDLRRQAELAVLHDSPAATGGILELVEAHRRGRPDAQAVTSLSVAVPGRNYHLLGGLHRARHWPGLRPGALAAGLNSLVDTFGAVICDVESDFEGADDGGSVDVAERNAPARLAALGASVVMVVGLPTLKGISSAVRVMSDLDRLGVDRGRVLPVINRAPRSPRERSRLAATLAQVVEAETGCRPGGLVFLPELDVEARIVDGRPLPPGLGQVLAGATAAVVRRLSPRAMACADSTGPVRIAPGSLATWGAA
ncbi:MAG: hypothetical protein ACT4OS_10585 [Acidimicrobiales bacterium]